MGLPPPSSNQNLAGYVIQVSEAIILALRIFKGSEDVQDESNVRPARQASNIQFSLVDATQDLFFRPLSNFLTNDSASFPIANPSSNLSTMGVQRVLVVAQVAYRKWRGDFALVLTLDGVVGSSQVSCSSRASSSKPERNQAAKRPPIPVQPPGVQLSGIA